MVAQGLNLPSNLRQEAFWGNRELVGPRLSAIEAARHLVIPRCRDAAKTDFAYDKSVFSRYVNLARLRLTSRGWTEHTADSAGARTLSDRTARLSLVAEYFDGWFRPTEVSPLPTVASKRTLSAAICNALIDRYTRVALESVLPEELRLEWRRDGAGPDEAETKRDLITGYIEDWSIAQWACPELS